MAPLCSKELRLLSCLGLRIREWKGADYPHAVFIPVCGHKKFHQAPRLVKASFDLTPKYSELITII
jgi:hypothetical protein